STVRSALSASADESTGVVRSDIPAPFRRRYSRRVRQLDLHRSSDSPLPRLALTAMEAPQALGVSHDFFREHVAAELRWVRRGRKKLVAVRELDRWLEENSARVFGESS
ncbi:MAG TPA: hypothetical protein VFA66_10530, partial [Gaiellaceae bacterium]|nr:hypothetical protein [Gaiellaceae bacterium]